jgi:lambda repressor-like predicted transcriptional regulator
VTTRRNRAPRDHIAAGQWPNATLDGDHAAATAQHIARRLAAVVAERSWSVAELHRRAGINRQTIANILDGRGWATIAVIADLERALDQSLWPAIGQHRGGVSVSDSR